MPTHRPRLQAAWGQARAQEPLGLRVCMGPLRKKVEDDPAQPRHLLTETGIGDRFVP